VNEFHQDTFVLEHVTLGLQVQLVVKMTVNLLGLTVTLEETPQNTHPFHPHFFLGHSGILGTFPLTVTGMTALATSFGVVTNTGPRMDSDRLLDHETILDKFADVLPGVGIGDLIDFIGIKPDLVLAAFHNRSGQALL